MNMNMPELSQTKYRKEITMEALKLKGIILHRLFIRP